MSNTEDRHLEFVLRHYKEGAFDTLKALRRFNDARGIKPKRRGWWSYAAVVIPVAAAVALGVFLFINNGSRQWTEVVADSGMKTVILPDGTDVTLSEGSSLRFSMKDVRKIKMDGKIYFDVARDEARPFEVEASGAFVRVLGTSFMLDVSGESGAEVYVEEGKVLFARDSDAEGVVLTEGMCASIDEKHGMPVIDESPDVNSIAWKRGYFIFDQTPLKDVLDCLSEYYQVSFAATDLSRRLSGEFQNDDLDLIIELIETALDVTIVRK